MSLEKAPFHFLSEAQSDEIESALYELETIGWTIASAEVAADNLAFSIKQFFFDPYPIGKKFKGKTSTLYEIVEALCKNYQLDDTALDNALEMKSALENTYMEDDGDFDEVKEWADALVKELRHFLVQFKAQQ